MMELDNNKLKFEAVTDCGYNLHVYIFNRKGEMVDKQYYPAKIKTLDIIP